MKKILNILLVGGAITMAACTDLETDPRNNLTPEIALTDATGYQSVAFSMYNRAINFGYYGQTMMVAPDILADNLRIIAQTGRYQNEEVNADRAHIDIWNWLPDVAANQGNRGIYAAINDANIIIAGIDDVPGAESLKNQVKGEALFMRALFYHDLSRVYGYEPGREVNGFNLGPVLRIAPTQGFSDADFRARSTNVEVYDQIIADLNAAIAILPAVAKGTAAVYRANKGAAEALMARVQLYRGNMGQAETFASQAMATFGLGNDGTGLVTAADYRAAFSTFPNPEALFELEIRQVDWSTVDGVNNSVSSLVSESNNGAQFILSASNELINAYEPGDVRRTMWTATTRSGQDGPVYSSDKWRGAKGQFLENLTIMRASELYLIRAEARMASNPQGALADINALRSFRGLGPVTGLSGTAILDQVLRERRVELSLEGHRFFDLKRNGMTITKHGNIPEVPYTDYRILANLPTAQVLLNDLLQQNPGYE